MVMFKTFRRIAWVAAAVVVGAVLGRAIAPASLREATSGAFHSGLTIEQFAELSELLVVKLDVSDVLVSDLHGRTGGVQMVVLVKGEVSLGVDLSGARFDHVDTAARVAELTLPPPGASRPRLDHEKTKALLIQKEGLWSLSPSNGPYVALFDQAMAEAQELVNAAGTSEDADSRARHHAEAVLQLFFKSLDWNVRIVWSDQR